MAFMETSELYSRQTVKAPALGGRVRRARYGFPPMAVEDYRIRLDGVRFRSKHGASTSERRLPQDFVANVELSFPPAVLPGGDDRNDVVDYDRIATAIVEEGTSGSCRLLETLARRIVDRIFADFPATRVRIAITKARPPTLSSVEAASVELLVARDA
jgi:7,8-dihydroneopterin aldolase/epimerase/oxygenase